MVRPVVKIFSKRIFPARKMEFPAVSVPEWDEPIDEAALDAAEAAFHTSKRPLPSSSRSDYVSSSPPPDDAPSGRRLPSWAATRHAPALIKHSSDGSPAALSNPRRGDWHLVPSPCLGKVARFSDHVKVKYPSIKFGGQIIYCRTVSEVEQATMKLLETIESRKNDMDSVSLGFDVEWRPIFRRGSGQRKVAVIQICTGADICHVMHIIHSGIPPILKSLLEDETSIKVGASIGGDAKKVWRDYEVSIKELEDLSHLANRKLGGVPRLWGLASLAETLTCKQLEKPKRIRLGNWESKELSREMLQYAADDAYVSWYLYQVLRSFSDANDNKKV